MVEKTCRRHAAFCRLSSPRDPNPLWSPYVKEVIHADSGSAALAITADLSLETDIQRIADTTLSHFDRLDILVNNAGIVHPRIDLVDFDPVLWRQVIEVNLMAAALLTKAVDAHNSLRLTGMTCYHEPTLTTRLTCHAGDPPRCRP